MELFSHDSIKTASVRYTQLKVYSSYSLGVGLNTPSEICALAARLGYSSVALTDIGGTYGFVEFHQAARRHGVKPIYGAVVRHQAAGVRSDERFDLTLLAVSPEGLQHVAALTSFSSAGPDAETALDLELLRVHTEGVVAFMGAVESEIAGLLSRGDEDNARRVIGAFKEILGERLFIEVQDHGDPEERVLAGKLLELAARTRTAPVLTREVRYLEKGMREMYGTLRGIRHPDEERDFFRIGREAASDWSLKTPVEMSQLRPFYEAAFDNTRRIDEMIAGDLLDGLDSDWPAAGEEETRREILERCERRLAAARRGDGGATEAARAEVVEREVAEALGEGLGPTLLLFHRVVERLRESNVDIGPATGLGLQSLCAHLLGVTAFDPYHYEPRFHPAFDSRLPETREFEIQVTGESRPDAMLALFAMFDFGQAAYLPAIERITAARAVRMASSVMTVPEAELAEVHEIIARQPGVSIERLHEQNERLGRLFRRSLAARDLLRRAALLEDLPVGIIKSRRSLALSPVPLTSFLGHSIDSDSGDLFLQSGRDNFPLSRVFRVDVTSLGALSVALRADDELRRTGVADYGWERLPADDPAVWQEIRRGDTTGIFLFEGETTLQRRESFRLDSLDDLTNFLSLMRFRDSEQSLRQRFEWFENEGVPPSDAGETVDAVMRTTRGHILYDEQIRDLIEALAGKTSLEAWRMVHDLRSPSPGVLSSLRTQFMIGAAEQGVQADTANRWFERLLRNSRTTTSRKRVFADALLVYKLFFIKTRHETAFYAALLNSSIDNEGKLARYLERLRTRQMIAKIDVNRSGRWFSAEEDAVRMGLCAVRGFDDEKIEHVLKARTRGEFASFEDFARRVGSRRLGREDLRALIDAGAFDSFGVARPELGKRLSSMYGRRRSRPEKEERKRQFELPLGD